MMGIQHTNWRYETAGDLDRTLLQRLKHFPREPDMLVCGLRILLALLVRSWLRLFHRLRIRGARNIPAGGCVLVCNHQSHLDTPSILSALPLQRLHQAYPAAARDYFFCSRSRTAIATILVNALPFARDTDCSESLRDCRKLLEGTDNTLILFPEGTRSTDGRIGRFKPGIGAIVAGSRIPVVPCRIDGADRAWPKGGWPVPRRVRLTIGEPVTFARRPRTREGAQRIAADLERLVRAL